jgi:protein O-mannosyl-transferase
MSLVRLAKNRPATLIALLLGLLTFALYLPMVQNKFIVFDDEAYITQNPHVTSGLTWSGIVWAFKTDYQANWHPLTWISHMLDCELYGLNPAGHHLTNALINAINTVLLFLLLRQLTGAIWSSAFVAAFFGWHPLHVESVAWAAERKDVLCAFFWLLTMIAYVKYVKKPGALFYLLALVLFACALMAKPMAVTLPFALLLLDFWPLNRFQTENFFGKPALSAIDEIPSAAPRFFKRGIVLTFEKLPFFALTLADCWVTFAAQKAGQAMWSTKALPFSYRAANAIWTYLRYISKTFWPVDLSIIYPYKSHLPEGIVIVAGILLVTWSVLFFLYRNRFPYLIVGWLWFLGILVPTIGLVQVGSQSMADRYMYLPSIGLFILIVWSVKDIIERKPEWKKTFLIIGMTALAACLAATSIQLNYWRNSISLFSHAVQVTSDNNVAYFCLGKACDEIGDEADALTFYSHSVQISKDYYPAQFEFGKALLMAGKYNEAVQHFNQALELTGPDASLEYNIGTAFLNADQIADAVEHLKTSLRENSDSAAAQANLGSALMIQHQFNQAASHFAKAIQLEPKDVRNYYSLGTVLLAVTNFDNAVAQFNKALQLKPDFPAARESLAQVFIQTGQTSKAIAQYRKILQLNPDDFAALNDLAWILATSSNAQLRSGDEAVQLAQHACELTHDQQPVFLTTLSAAYAEIGQFTNAISTVEKARELASTANQAGVVAQDEKMLKLYQLNRPYYD